MKRLRDLGERELINWIVKRLDECDGATLPPGDDASDMLFKGRLLMSCDMLAASTDIPPGMRIEDVGFKAITSATSDIAAKGGRPLAYLISLMLPPDMPFEDFQGLWRGFEEAARLYGGKIVGGDINSGKEIVIDVTCLGEAERTFSRLGARPGDILATTGEFGAQAAGLHAFISGLGDDPISSKVAKKFSRPIARVEEALELTKIPAITSSIDSSDGLAESLHELAEFNDVGFIVDNPPVSEDARAYAEKFGVDLFDLVFYGGEEYELILTIKPRFLDEAIKSLERIGGRLFIIGRVVEGGDIMARWRGEWVDLERRGYQHFI
ncbi:MAG: thiamine-phosphate kinase [Aigarchaeota archaeon]|nr:thiamine-phosphate kinase [Aigarchaeota archaeon]